MKKLLLTMLLAFASVFTFAQTNGVVYKGKISGSLFDEKKQALPFANILLLKAKDSTLTKGAVSDLDGKFSFEQIAVGNDAQYIVSVSMVGYKKYFSPKIILNDENLEVKLSTVQLELDTKNLKEVTVTAKKTFIEQAGDKLIVNVEGSIVATGSTALEVLQKSPGVTVDNNDNISVKGKQGVLVIMDGKPTYMSQSDLANQLKNMSSDQIEKIEIISNPSARYDAAGKAVINIITKKNKNFGTNGSISAGSAISFPPVLDKGLSNDFSKIETVKPGMMPKYNSSLNLNNRQGKLNTFANLTFSDNQRFNNNVLTRDIGGKVFEQYAVRYNESQNFSYKLGSDYYASKKTTLGFLVNGSAGIWQNSPLNPAINQTYIKNTGKIIPDSSLRTTSSSYQTWKNVTINGNFKHTFDSTGKELTADIDYSIYDNFSRERGMITQFFKYIDNKETEIANPLNITSQFPNKYNIFALKTDYVHPLPNAKARLEFGAKSSWVKSDNDIVFYQNGTVDKGRTNYFIYEENINAAYANFNKELSKKWSLQAGLRMEHTHSTGTSITLNESRERNYVKLFPSAFLTQTINKNNQLSYSYSRRIERPDYGSLNPFINFLDPYTYQLGNEYLKPQYTNSFELTHSFKQAFVTSIGYSVTNDFMTEVIKNAINEPLILEKIKKYNNIDGIDPEKITFATRENIAKFKNINMNLSFPIPITKWWSSQNNVSFYYNKYSGELLGQTLNTGQFAYNFYTSQNLKLPKSLTAEVSMWYNSRNIYGMMLGKAQYAVNAGLQKSFWNKKASLKLNVNDIFLTSFWAGRTDFANVKLDIRNRWDSRNARLTFTYKFGNQNVKAARRRSTATEAEQSRVKTGG
jgi:Outer membrane protein beta-barrel family/CarboxypepD_reg-like domain/TonB-dependent Receptor Plug Domain